MNRKSISDQQIMAAFQETGSAAATARLLGVTRQGAHARLKKLGADMQPNLLSDADRALIRAVYVAFRDQGRLADLAQQLGRTKPFICREARRMGLTKRP